MSVDRKEIDLIIRAALQNGSTLDSVAKSIQTIEKALDSQTAAAKRGESSIDQLKATLEALKQTQDKLKDQAGLIGQFQRLSDQLGASAEKSAKAAKTYDEYKAKLDAAGDATDKQREKLIKLGAATERVQVTIAKQRADHAALTQTLTEAGVEMDKLGDAENRVRTAAAQLGVVISRTQQAIATYADDVRKAREEERARAVVAAESSKLQSEEARRLNDQRMFRQAMTNQRLSEIKVLEDEVSARQRAAAAAETEARGYKTLGRPATNLSASTGGLRSAIQAITDPSAGAIQTLSGVEAQVLKIGAAVTAIKGPVEDYRGQVQQLSALQKAVSEQAGMVDAYQRQVAALRQARSEFTAARAQVLEYANALRNSAGQNDTLQASLRSAQATLAGAQRNLASQLSTTRDLRQSLRDAGIATNDLAGTQSRLTGAAQSSTTTLQRLNAALKQFGQASNEASISHGIFDSSGRTTLSLMQRIRGEVLSMVAAYAGLYGAINTAKGSIDAFNERNVTQNRLAVIVGNEPAKIANEYKYLQDQSERIGLDFTKVSDSYARFAIAATKSGASLQETKYIFESFAEAGTVLGLDGERMKLVFVALEQMMSKGKIAAEELRQQLSEHLPGAFEIFQQSVKGKFPDLNQALKDGKVSAAEILNFAESYRNMVASRLPTAMSSLIAQQNRFNNAILGFKLTLADSGFIERFTDLIKRLTEYLKSEDGTKFAKGLSGAFETVATTLKWIVDNSELVKQTLIVGVFLLGARTAAGFAVGMIGVAEKLGLLTVVGVEAAAAIRGVGRAFGLVAAGAIGWEIGTILYEKFKPVRELGVGLVFVFESAWTIIKYGAQILWGEMPAIFVDGLATLGNLVTSGVRGLLGIFSTAARGVGKNDLADSIDKAIEKIQFRTNRIGNASAQLREQLKRDLAQIQKISREMILDIENPNKASGAPAPAPVATTVKPGQSSIEDKSKENEKRLKAKQEIEAELAVIEAKIERQEKTNLASRLAAISDGYYRLVEKIKKLGGADGAELAARLKTSIGELSMQETRKFNEALLAEQESLNKRLGEIDSQAGRAQKTDLAARLNAVTTSYQDEYLKIEAFRKKLAENNRSTEPADLMTQRLGLGIQAIQAIETQKYYEDSLNKILDERKAKLDVIAVQEKTGLLTATQAREKSAQVVSETQPKLEAVVAEGLKYVDAMIMAAEATGANTTALETLKAKLIDARESAKGLRTEFLSAAQVNEMLASGATTAFQTMAEAIGGAIRGVNSWGDAIRATRNAFLKFAADFLMSIAQMIMKQALLNALQSSGAGGGGGFGGLISSAVGALLKHDGGVVNGSGPIRQARVEWFSNAPRYHGGGIPGLAPNEYPAILKKNEEVLTQNDPRNVLNGGKLSAGSGSSSLGVKIINMIDSGSVVSEGLSSQAGERAIYNFIRANRTGLKQLLA